MRGKKRHVASALLVLSCLLRRDAVAGNGKTANVSPDSPAVTDDDALRLTKRPSSMPATLQGITELNWSTSERGVSYIGSTRTRLRTELESEKDGTVTLRAVGQRESQGGFVKPDRGSQLDKDPVRPPTKFHEIWTGHWAQAGTAVILRLSKANEHPVLSRDFQCRNFTELSGKKRIKYVRCDLVQEDTEMNWKGVFSHFMRVPLIFSAKGNVEAFIDGGRGGSATVTVSPAPPPRPAPGKRP